jgi:hypothetical protein
VRTKPGGTHPAIAGHLNRSERTRPRFLDLIFRMSWTCCVIIAQKLAAAIVQVSGNRGLHFAQYVAEGRMLFLGFPFLWGSCENLAGVGAESFWFCSAVILVPSGSPSRAGRKGLIRGCPCLGPREVSLKTESCSHAESFPSPSERSVQH